MPTCAPSDSLADVRSRSGETPWNICVAVVQDRVVQGLLRLDEHPNDDGQVQDFMDPAIRTFRPFARPKTLLESMDRNKVDTALVTTSAGQLLGAVRRADVARAVQAHQPK